jgi:hypothetical protein
MHAFRLSIPLLTLAAGIAAKGVWTTPHDSYSSSVGVLGCKINTDRVAYWPGSIDCNNICIKLSHGGRSVHLLRIDQSGGAYDISYDAWNYLQTGNSAATNPTTGGTVAMEYEEVDASECANLIYTPGSKLPLSAPNSINFLSSCLAQPGSWVAKNHILYNICDAICSLGYDEECSLDLAISNQPSCSHTLGLTSKLTTAPVYNIQYQSGKIVVAGTGEVVTPNARVGAGADEGGSTSQRASSQTAQSTPTAAIFVEQKSTSVLTKAPVTSSSSSAVSVETPSSAVQVPTTVAPAASSFSQTAAVQSTLTLSASEPNTKVSTTMSVVTISSSQSAASNSPTGVATVQTVNAGHVRARVPALVLASSVVILSILTTF